MAIFHHEHDIEGRDIRFGSYLSIVCVLGASLGREKIFRYVNKEDTSLS